jgi:hypothetical protein
MKLENYVFGSLSFSFLIGYLSLILGLILLFTAQSPIYHEVAASLQKIPLSTILLASPLAVIIGIILNSIRCTVNKYILRRPIYVIDEVSDEIKELFYPVISSVLCVSEKKQIVLDEKAFLMTRAILLPKFDEYSIKSRWLHDFLDTIIYVSVTCILIVSFRAVAQSFHGIEFYVLLIMSVSAVFAYISLKELKIKYIQAELSVIINEKMKLKNIA